MISNFLQAVSFLTIFPVPVHKESGLEKAMFFFPLVGFLLGVLSIGLAHFISLDVFVNLHALALVTFPILFTRALHLDGFADFCDGFFCGKGKEEILRIMKDSRIGVFGAAGVFLLIFWKWQLLTSIPGRGVALLLALTASRWSSVVLAYFLPYAGIGPGLGEAVAKKVTLKELAGATAFLSVLVLFLKGPGVICFLALLPFLAGAGFLFKKKMGGITGDLLGAATEATELFIFFALFMIKTATRL